MCVSNGEEVIFLLSIFFDLILLDVYFCGKLTKLDYSYLFYWMAVGWWWIFEGVAIQLFAN